MALRWSEDSRTDLQRIHDFDAARHASGLSARLLGDRQFVRSAARRLHDGIITNPGIVPGSRRNDDEKRWLPIKRGFVIVYRASRIRVEILNVYHERELHRASMPR